MWLQGFYVGWCMLTDDQDELRLLRLRTKKHEIVIVLDPKYLLTVIHDTPTS